MQKRTLQARTHRVRVTITSSAAMRATVLCVSLALPGPCLPLLLGALCSLKQLHCVAPCAARTCSDTCSVSLVLARSADSLLFFGLLPCSKTETPLEKGKSSKLSKSNIFM